MKEEFLHFIFKNRLWNKSQLCLTDGRLFEIVDVGHHNKDSGPDFFNSKIKIDDTVWVGSIEIHINSSDWYKHKHQNDLAYSNVILHVVYKHDEEVFYSNDKPIPVWEISFPQVLYNKYSELKNNETDIPCAEYIDMVDKFKLGMWLERMGVERLEYKSSIIDDYLSRSNNDWEYAFYLSLSRSFGGGLNSFAFEQLAISTPLKLVRKYSDSQFKLEALLFGQSGLLEDAIVDDYVIKLKTEYNYLRNLYKLSPIPAHYWKFSKLRPANFPQIKIAQLVSVLQGFQALFSEVIIESDKSKLFKYFKVNVSEYWKTHYVFGKPVDKTSSGFGKTLFESIVINTLAPFIFKYFKDMPDSNNGINHYSILSGIKPENNRHIRIWKKLGFEPHDAFSSQALLHLKKYYCDKRNCLTCQIGHNIMQQISKI